MVVVTRDMFGIAMKATYGIVDGKPIMIYKDPKTDTSHLKNLIRDVAMYITMTMENYSAKMDTTGLYITSITEH